MNPDPCENHQLLLSRSIDDCQPIPPALERHVSSCPDCAAFVRFCREAHPLSKELPGADAALRQRILKLASGQPSRTRPRVAIPLAAAAAVAIGFGIHWYARPVPEKPSPPAEVADTVTNPPSMAPVPDMDTLAELAALRYALDRGLSQLAQPLVVFNSLQEPR